MSSKTFFCSDLHLGHNNIIKYCNRPFANAYEMDNALIHNWNSVITPDDVVYYLGDFCFSPRGVDEKVAENYLRRLNGHIHFIKGNHDKPASKIYTQFSSFHNCYLEIAVEGQDITLCHYALRVFNKSHHGSWHLYGHSHGTLPDDPNSLSFDVGVDCHNYFPISLDQVKKIMSKKTWKPIDHHGKK